MRQDREIFGWRKNQTFGAAGPASVKAWIEKYFFSSVHTPDGVQPTPRANAPSDSTVYF
jgi:hypothetical protein